MRRRDFTTSSTVAISPRDDRPANHASNHQGTDDASDPSKRDQGWHGLEQADEHAEQTHDHRQSCDGRGHRATRSDDDEGGEDHQEELDRDARCARQEVCTALRRLATSKRVIASSGHMMSV